MKIKYLFGYKNIIKSYISKQEVYPSETQMIQEFQKLLQTPKPTSQTYLKMMQDSMLNTMEELMPQNFDFGQLAQLFSKQSQSQNLTSLTYKLNQFFVRVISENFISLQSYFGLEEQTQKLESTIRGHIKMQQQMKMYLEHLEYKIQRYEHHLKKIKNKQNGHDLIESSDDLKQFKEKDSLEQLKKRQTQLLKERLILLRKVDHLERKLRDHESQLRRLNSPTSATIQQIKQGINRERRVSQIQQRVAQTGGQNNVIISVTQVLKPNLDIDRRLSTNSFGSDNQMTQKKTSIPINIGFNTKMYSVTGREHQGTSLSLIQHLDTRNLIMTGQTSFCEEKGENKDNDYQDLNSPIEQLIKVE